MTADARPRCVPMTPERAADWERFFAEDAFADNPDWASCWCRCFRAAEWAADWDGACERGENRAPMLAAARAGTLRGVLAYAGDRVVGWCQADARAAFRFRKPGQDAASPDAPEAAAIVCFLVAPAWRGRGVARALLREACAELARRGFTSVDAFPRKAGGCAELFGGPAELLRAAGFAPAADLGDRWVLRRALAAAR